MYCMLFVHCCEEQRIIVRIAQLLSNTQPSGSQQPIATGLDALLAAAKAAGDKKEPKPPAAPPPAALLLAAAAPMPPPVKASPISRDSNLLKEANKTIEKLQQDYDKMLALKQSAQERLKKEQEMRMKSMKDRMMYEKERKKETDAMAANLNITVSALTQTQELLAIERAKKTVYLIHDEAGDVYGRETDAEEHGQGGGGHGQAHGKRHGDAAGGGGHGQAGGTGHGDAASGDGPDKPCDHSDWLRNDTTDLAHPQKKALQLLFVSICFWPSTLQFAISMVEVTAAMVVMLCCAIVVSL